MGSIQLTNLQVLSLSRNQLSTLPPEIGQLAELGWLDLSDNDLTVLPPEIGQLTKLGWLGLSDNPLGNSLPAEISQLLQSVDVDFDGNLFF